MLIEKLEILRYKFVHQQERNELTLATSKRKIFKTVKTNNTWRKRFNTELYRMYKDCDILQFIKVSRNYSLLKSVE